MQLDKKNRIVFFHTYPFDTAPGQRFRYEQYLKYLETDHEIILKPFLSDSLWAIYYEKGRFVRKSILLFYCFIKRFFDLFSVRNSSVFIFREVAPMGPPIFEWILAKVFRVKYIYDFDDAIWLPNYSAANAKIHWFKMYWKVNFAMKWAYKITAGNDYLAQYARQFNRNVEVIPTTIDTENHHTILSNHDENKVVIGWTGTHSTMHYLNEIVPLIQELEKKFDFEFRVISNQDPDFELKSMNYIPWNKATEIEDLSRMHIGVMPLKQDIWSAGKCGFKGLQYMALGISTVMSPVGVNSAIVQHGVNGFLPDSIQEWKETLELLLQNPELRKKVGEQGRKRIEEVYSVEANKGKYLGLFD